MRRPPLARLMVLLVFTSLVGCSQATPPTSPTPSQPTERPTRNAPTIQPTTSPTIPPTTPPVEAADLVFVGGDVITMDPDKPQAEAAAVRGDRIVAVGQRTEVEALVGPDTEVVDLAGRTLMPGFVDPHTHLFNDAGSMDSDLAGAQRIALSNGITTLGDMYATQEFVDQMQAFDDAGDLIVRTSLYLTMTDNCGQPTGDWWQAIAPTRNPGETLRIGGLKAFADGGTCGKLAASQDVFPGYGPGDLFFNQDEMDAMFKQATELGYQLAVHAQGDRAVGQVLNALGTVAPDGQNPLRHRIEHNAIVTPDLYPLYGRYDVVAPLFGYRPVCDTPPTLTDFYKQYGENWRALLDANPGGHFAWHGDDPWVPTLNPLNDLASYVTREEVRDDGQVCPPPDWLAPTAITVDEAFRMMTTEAAYALFREAEVGSIEPGKYADLIVLNMNPRTIDPHQLWDLELQATIVGGQAAYCVEPLLPLCDDSGMLLGPS